ncbi:MAG TPA: anthranilate phosphoribosyltransferase, partial [Bacteroidales bacterium]|nr:anthranilate phosphoribosyltransferase [Bacteroidales bacterium]
KSLTREQARMSLKKLAGGSYSESEMAAFLTVFNMRKIKPEELAGFRDAMLDLAVQVDLNDHDLIDVCGTGGDEKNTFNVSTLSAFVLAGAGVKVAKHGNYAVSSPCGSSNILEHFGYHFGNDLSKLQHEIEKTNICYLHAPLFHPAMKNIAPVRRALKVKTFFNILGPMVNPARPENQLIGVFSEEVQQLYAEVYKQIGVNHIIVYSLDGYDEISLTGDFRYISLQKHEILTPDSLGLLKIDRNELFGGNTVQEAAGIFEKILSGNGTEAQQNVVIANSAMALQCYYPEKDIEDCVVLARESLESKRAFQTLKKLMDIQSS